MASDNVPDISVRQNLDDCFIPGCTAYVGCNDVAFFNMSFGDLPHWWKGTAWAEKYQTELPIDAKICGMHFEERFIDRSKKKPRLIMGTIPTLRLALLEKVIEENNSKEYFCRLCAKKSSQKFNGRLDKLPGLETIVEYCLGIYKNQLSLPMGVCDNCIQTIDTFSNFIKKCEKSQALLLHTMKNDEEKITKKGNKASATDNRLSIESDREQTHVETNVQNTKDSFSNNFNNSSKKKPDCHSCSDCGKLFKNSMNYSIHLETNNENEFMCQICEKKFMQRSDLKYHLQFEHNDNQSGYKNTSPKNDGNELDAANIKLFPDEHKCAQCVKTFSSPANLKVHLLSHSIPRLKCDICGAVFRTKHMHMQHIIRAHTLEIKKNKEQDAPRKRRKKGIQLIRLAEEN
ncbi:RB-associated KRAB zinc finger protein-like isoform X1 [Wyeomyia smithii]|uniref:RB-associated KRAB zinc finger protein-like isoform X1 n=1 Tax=Wyeomyia smithii TaxID=174621 RepID=UPI002467E131|nr:RB-associated KRAB zinc finger protein-like isoform X1 [Wyeomyia smithii]